MAGGTVGQRDGGIQDVCLKSDGESEFGDYSDPPLGSARHHQRVCY